MCPSPATADRPPTLKSVLFCPDCDHTSPVDGDWFVVETGAETEYVCPECGAVIQARPAFDGPDRRGIDLGLLVSAPVATFIRSFPLLRP